MRIHLTHTFDTYEEAYAWGLSFLAAFHPYGYGTRVEDPKQTEDGRWIVHASRYSSCD